MTEQSDKLITEVAKAEYQRLKDSVIRAAKNWHYTNGQRLAFEALDAAIESLVSFEKRHRDRLND